MNELPVPSNLTFPEDSFIGFRFLSMVCITLGFGWWYSFAGLFSCWIGKLLFLFLLLPIMYVGWCIGAILSLLILGWVISWCLCMFVFCYNIANITNTLIITPITLVLSTTGYFIRDNIVPFLKQF